MSLFFQCTFIAKVHCGVVRNHNVTLSRSRDLSDFFVIEYIHFTYVINAQFVVLVISCSKVFGSQGDTDFSCGFQAESVKETLFH